MHSPPGAEPDRQRATKSFSHEPAQTCLAVVTRHARTSIHTGVAGIYLISVLLNQPIPVLAASGTVGSGLRADRISSAELHLPSGGDTVRRFTVLQPGIREVGGEGEAGNYNGTLLDPSAPDYGVQTYRFKSNLEEPGRHSPRFPAIELAERARPVKSVENKRSSAAGVDTITPTEPRVSGLRAGTETKDAFHSRSPDAEGPVPVSNAPETSATRETGLQGWSLLDQVSYLIPKIPPSSIPFLHQPHIASIGGEAKQQIPVVNAKSTSELPCLNSGDGPGTGQECERWRNYTTRSGVLVDSSSRRQPVPLGTLLRSGTPSLLRAREALPTAGVFPGRGATSGAASPNAVTEDHGESRYGGCREPAQRTLAEARRRKGEPSFVPVVMTGAKLDDNFLPTGPVSSTLGTASTSDERWSWVWLTPCRLLRKAEAVEYMFAPGFGADDFSSYRYMELLVDVQRLDEGDVDVGEIYVRKNNHPTLFLYDAKQRLPVSGLITVPLAWGHHKWFITVHGSEKLSATRVTHLVRPRADSLLIRLGLALSKERVPFLSPGATLILPASSAANWRREMSTSRSTGSSSTSKTWSELTDGQPDIRTGSNQNAHAGGTENVSVVETPTSSSLLSLGIFGVRTQPLKFRCTSVGEAHCNENDARFCICVASPHKAALSFSLQYQLGGGGLRPAAVRRRSRPEANHGSRASQRSGNAGGRGNAIHPLDPPDAARLPPSARGEQITEPTTKSTTPACLLSMLPVKLHLLFEDVSKVQSEGASQSAVGPDAELIPGGASSCSEGPGALLINSPDCSQPSHNGCGSPASKQGEHDNRESVRWLGAVPMNTGVTTEGHSAGKETLGCTENRWLEEVIAEVRELGYHESLYVTPHECLPAGLRTRVSAVRVQTRVSLLGDGQDFASHVDGEGWTVEHRVDLLHVAQGDILVTAVQQLSSFRSQDRVVRGTKFHHIPTTPEWQEPAVKGLQVSMEASTCSNREAVQSFERSVEELHLETETRRRAQPSPPLKKPTSWRDRGQKESPGVATRAAYLALRRDLGEEIQAGGYQELSLFGSSPTHGFLSQTPLYRLIQERLQRSAGGLHETATPRPTSLITGHAQRSCFTHSVGHGNDVTAANASEPDPARAVKTTERSIVASDEPATSPHLDESSFWSPGSNHTGRAQSEVAEGSSKKHSTNVRTGSVTADTNTTRSSKRPAQPFTQVVFQDSSSKHSWESLPGKCSPPFSARMAGRTLQQDLNSHLPPLHARRYAARKKSLPSGSTVVAINGGWSYGLAYLGRNDLCPATILRSTLVIPEAFLNPVTPLKVQVMLRRGAVPLAVEGALAHGSWRTSESPHASHQQDSTAAATSIQDAAGVKDHTSCSDFVADTAFEWTLTSLHLDKARQARGLLEVETPPLKHLKPGQYVVGWRVVVRQVKIAAVEDSQHPDTRANNHVGHFRRAASRRQDVWTDLQQTEYPEDPSDSTKASQSGKTAASDLPKRNTAAAPSRGGSDGKQTGNWISSRPLWTLQVNQLLRLLGSISVSQGLEEQSMSHFRDRILNDRSQDPSQPAGESLDRVQADTLRGRVDPDQAAEAEVDTISSADSRGEVPQAHHSVYFCLRGACIQLFFSFRVADLCPLGCDNGSHCVAHPARGHWEYVCLCREGFMGDRCELKSLPDFASSAVMLSNLAIVPAVAWAAKIRDFLASAAFLFTGMASLFYHVCYSEHWCILPPHTLSVLDHAGSLSSFVCVAVRLMHFEKGRTRQRLLASLLLLVSALLFFQGGVTALGLGLLFSILGILFLSRITYVLLKSESRAGREAAELQNSLEGAVRDAFEQEIFNISVTHPCFLYEECLTEEDGKGEERGDESLEDSSSTLLSTAGSTSRGSTGFQSFGEPEAPCISEAEFVGDSSDSEPACSVLTHASSSVSRGSVFTTSRTGFFRERLQQGGTRLFSNEHGSGMKPASGCCVEDLPVPVPVTETGGVKRVARAVIPVPQRSRRGGIVVDICESPGKGKPSSASDTQDGDLGHSDVAGDDGSDGREPQRSTTGNEHSHLFWTGGAFEEIVPCRARSSTVNFTISAPRPYRRVVSSVQSGQPADSLEECGLGLRSATSPTENQVRDFFCTQTVHLERDRHVYRRHSAPQQPHFFQFPMAVAEVRNEVRGDGVDHDTESTTVGANKITVIVSGIIRNARLGHGLGNGDGVTLFSRLVPCIRSTARRVFKSSDVATTPRSPSTQEPYLPDEGFDTFVDALSWRGTAVAVTLQHYLVPSRPVFLLSGLAATGAAAACWQLATNETYWVIHAFWHLFIMLSPFLAYKVHEDKRSENPFPVYLNFQTEGRAQREI